jgi:hypothetical protein
MKKEIEVEVQTTTQCSFIPFTVVPDGWKGMKVRVVLVCEERAFELETESEVPWK